MKNVYIAMAINENGKQYAYVLKFNKCNNLLNLAGLTTGYKNVEFALLCDTQKHAQEVVNNWVETYKRNKTYMFDYS